VFNKIAPELCFGAVFLDLAEKQACLAGFFGACSLSRGVFARRGFEEAQIHGCFFKIYYMKSSVKIEQRRFYAQISHAPRSRPQIKTG
jgi:hypothetical protein